MRSEIDKDRWFVVRWVAMCGLGLGAGLSVGLALGAPIEALVGMMLVTPIVLAIAGSTFGAAQWLAIWSKPRAGALWVAASAAGLGLGMTVGVVLVEMLGRALTGEQVRLLTLGPLGRLLGLGLVGIFSGLAVGVAQGIAMRARGPATARWVLWCGAGFAIGLPAGSLAADLLLGGLRSAAGFLTFLGVAGLAVGALTARAAMQLTAKPNIPEHRPGR